MRAQSIDPLPHMTAVTGLDGQLWAEGSGGYLTPGGWTALGGYLLGAPAVASIPDATGPDYGDPIFVGVGTDHRLWVRDFPHSWQVLANGYCVDNPAAVVVRAGAAEAFVLTVGCEGSDGALWYGQELVSYDVLPATLPSMQPLGGGLLTGPAVAAVPSNGAGVDGELTFFVLGTDQHIWTRTLASGWHQMPWLCIGHPAASTSLSGSVWLTAFGCHGADGQLWASMNTGSGWTAAKALGGILNEGPGVAVDPTFVYFDVEGVTRALWENANYSTGGTLMGWYSLGGLSNTGAAAAALLLDADNP